MINFFVTLTCDSIHTIPFPITELLENSVYYPSSHFDRAVVKAYAYDFLSFVYCDYSKTNEDLAAKIPAFRGYNVLAHRLVQNDELVPHGWQLQIPHQLLDNFTCCEDSSKALSAHWAVYERQLEYTGMHGPDRFSLLYVGGQAVATYQTLYWSNQITAKAVAIVRPDTGFDSNWINFLDDEKALGYVVTQNPYGQPDRIICEDLSLFNWRSYPRCDRMSARHCRYSREHSATFFEYTQK